MQGVFWTWCCSPICEQIHSHFISSEEFAMKFSCLVDAPEGSGRKRKEEGFRRKVY